MADKKKSAINQNYNWNKNKKRETLYKLKKQIKQANFELEMLKKDPAATHNEIADLDSKLSKWKHEYAERVRQLKRRNNNDN